MTVIIHNIKHLWSVTVCHEFVIDPCKPELFWVFFEACGAFENAIKGMKK
jgi:hypothetical protein